MSLTLTILGDASGAKRALGETVADGRRAIGAMSADARRGAQQRRQGDAEEIAGARRQLKAQYEMRARAMVDRLRAEKAAKAQRDRLAKDSTAEAARAEKERTANASKESTARQKIAEKEAAEASKAEKKKTADASREDKRRTRLAETEAKNRARAVARVERQERQELRGDGRRWGGAIGAVAGGAREFASSMDGEIQSARHRRAPTERALGSALYQAGGTRADVVAQMSNVTGYAAANNMDSGELANALNAAQTEFSVLGNARTPAADRNRRVESFLETARLARDTGNDVGEFTRLQGLFGDSRIDPTTQRQLLLYAAGAAQRGSIEVGSITREAMGSIRGRIGASMADAQRTGQNPQQAAADTFRQAMAELEVSRSTGENPRAAGNAIQSLNTALRGDVTQQRLLGNIHSFAAHASPEQRTRLAAMERQLFEADPNRRGHRRLTAKYQDSLQLYEAFDAAGLSAADTMNLTRGGGRGNPLSALSNQRRVLGNLLNPDAEGVKGIGRIRDIMANSALTDADVARGHEVFANDAQAVLTGNQEAHDNALRDNNDRLVRVSDAINNWKMRHPWLNQGAESGVTAGGGVVNALTGGAATAAATKLLGVGAKVGSPGGLIRRGVGAVTGRALPAVQRALGVLAPFLGLAGGIATASAAGGIALGSYGSMETARTGVGADGQRVSTGERVARGAAAVGSSIFVIGPLISAIRDMPRLLASELRSQPLTATVSPHDAGLAGAEGGGSRNMPPTP